MTSSIDPRNDSLGNQGAGNEDPDLDATIWEDIVDHSETGLTVLLVSLIAVLFVVYPLAHDMGRFGRLVVDGALSLSMLSGAVALSDCRPWRISVTVLAAIAFSTRWLANLQGHETLDYVCLLTIIAFLAVAVAGTLSKVIGQGPITRHRLEGAVAVYLMIALLFSFLFLLVETHQPGSFSFPEDEETVMSEMVYFSFVTLTTVGYGDVTPVGRHARTLAILEALIGQFYLAILVARLVSLTIMEEKSHPPP